MIRKIKMSEGYYSVGGRFENGKFTVSADIKVSGDYHIIHAYNNDFLKLLKIQGDIEQIKQLLNITFNHGTPTPPANENDFSMIDMVSQIHNSPQGEIFKKLINTILGNNE
jgi:hypothetical protein